MAMRVKAAVAAALAARKKPVNVKYVLGRCVPSAKENAAKIRVSQLHLDEKLNMVSDEFNKFHGI